MTSRCEKRTVSGGRNTIHLLWSLNQADRCVPMIHDAPALQLKPQRIFTRTHTPYTTCATANSNMMLFRPIAQYVSASSINNGHALFCFYGLYIICWYITLSIWSMLCCLTTSWPICFGHLSQTRISAGTCLQLSSGCSHYRVEKTYVTKC